MLPATAQPVAVALPALPYKTARPIAIAIRHFPLMHAMRIERLRYQSI
jgi:hypothetical protein